MIQELFRTLVKHVWFYLYITSHAVLNEISFNYQNHVSNYVIIHIQKNQHWLKSFEDKFKKYFLKNMFSVTSYMGFAEFVLHFRSIIRDNHFFYFTAFFWQQLKPLIRGKILYTPETKATFQLMHMVNMSFSPFLEVIFILCIL